MVKVIECQWISIPLADVDQPGRYSGQCSIQDKVYGVIIVWHTRADGRGETAGVQLTQTARKGKDRRPYQLSPFEGKWLCDCPDTTFNSNPNCKHSVALAELFSQLVDEYAV